MQCKLDFNFCAAALNISRVHMHQGTDYRYGAWQPLSTSLRNITTLAPYCGQIAATAILGNTLMHVRIAGISLPDRRDAAYATEMGR